MALSVRILQRQAFNQSWVRPKRAEGLNFLDAQGIQKNEKRSGHEVVSHGSTQ